jgi:hypothetical protein
MINFSKVARQLKEEPMVDDGSGRGIRRFQREPIVRNTHRTGDQGFKIEDKVVNHVLPHHKPSAEFAHVDAEASGSTEAVKTDIIEKRDRYDIGYSVKSKGDNDDPMKVHQTKAGSPAGLFSKLKASTNTEDGYESQVGDSKIRQALIMAFGSHKGSLGEMSHLFGDLSDEQRNILNSREGRDNPYLTPAVMKEHFNDHYATLKNHLDRKKFEIFTSLVRQQGSPRYGSPYVDHDPTPVQKLIQHRRDSGTAPNDLSGTIDILDIGGRKVTDAMARMSWFDDGERFYMSDEETDDIDKRMLDLYPINKENSKWAMRPGDDEGPVRQGDRGYKQGVREYGLAEPGHFKATMGTNPEWLHQFFRPESSYHMEDRGQQMDPRITRI